MTNELSLESHVLVLKDGTLIHLTKEQANLVTQSLTTSNTDLTLMIGDSMIMKSAVSHLVPMAMHEETLRRKRGEWKCKAGHWHTREDKTCEDVQKQQDEMVQLIGGGSVHISEILKDQDKPDADRIYERDKTARGWKLKDQNKSK